MELDAAKTPGRALVKQECIVGIIKSLRHGFIFPRREEIVLHELDDQRHVDVHRAFEFWQAADIDSGHLKIHVFLKALGRNHVPEKIDHLLALGGDLHLDDRVVQQVPAIVFRGRTHIVGCTQGKQFHGHQPGPCIGKQGFHMREVGDIHIVELAVRRVINGLVKRMRTHANRCPAQVEFTHVDRVQRSIPSVISTGQNLLIGDLIIFQPVLGNIRLAVDHVFDQVVILVL